MEELTLLFSEIFCIRRNCLFKLSGPLGFGLVSVSRLTIDLLSFIGLFGVSISFLSLFWQTIFLRNGPMHFSLHTDFLKLFVVIHYV